MTTSRLQVGLLLVLMLGCLAYVQQPRKASKSSKTSQAVLEVHNSFCPVTGKPVEGEHNHVHENRRYGLCSGECAQILVENSQLLEPSKREK